MFILILVVLQYIHVHLKEGRKTMATKKAAKKSVTVKPKVSSASLDGFTSKLSERAFVGSLLIEVLGTFLLALAFMISQGQPVIMLFAMIAVVVTVGTKGGVHLNPAVTIAAWLTKNVNGFRATMYVLGQFLGAVLAYGVLKYFVDAADTSSASAMFNGAQQMFHIQALPKDKQWYVLLAEAIGALVLGYGYASALKSKNDKMAYGVSLGLALFVSLVFASAAVSYVGGSAVLNPAITAVLGADFNNYWTYLVYLLAPTVGALLGFVLNRSINTDK